MLLASKFKKVPSRISIFLPSGVSAETISSAPNYKVPTAIQILGRAFFYSRFPWFIVKREVIELGTGTTMRLNLSLSRNGRARVTCTALGSSCRLATIKAGMHNRGILRLYWHYNPRSVQVGNRSDDERDDERYSHCGAPFYTG